MPDIKKNKFWVVIGGVITLMITLYFVFVNPYRLETSKKIGTIENVLTQLKVYERKGSGIINKECIEMEKTKLEAIRREQLRNKELLKKRDHNIEKIFSVDYDGKIVDEALWKNEYIQRVNHLLGTLARSNISVSNGALPFKEWGEEIPTRDKIVEEQKRFWIAEELLNIIQKGELKVSNLEGINFRKGGFSPDNAHPELYDIIPFTVKVSMDTEGILFLINELLESKLSFEIETVNISGKLNKLRSSEFSEKLYSIPPHNMVYVVIEAYAIDFKA